MRRKGLSVIKSDAVHHIYQNTVKGYLLFYSVKDYLVLLTIIMTAARRHGVVILGLCLMPDHIHLLVRCAGPEPLRAFVRDYTRLYTCRFNSHYGFSGPVFNTPFGRAPKLGNKKIRTAIAYLYNNPVEGHICTKAEDNRWNFLAYGAAKYPFSEKMRMDRIRWGLRKALYLVKAFRRQDRPLDYQILERMTCNLSATELQQFTDYVIWKYNQIDYSALIRYYGTYDKMLTAIDSNTGSEYDIEEDTFAKDYSVYPKMIRHLCQEYGVPMREILHFPDERKVKIAYRLQRLFGVSRAETAKLLRFSAEM